MAETQTIELYLSQPQFLKYRKGKAFQLTNAQLQSDNGKNKVSIDQRNRKKEPKKRNRSKKQVFNQSKQLVDQKIKIYSF